MNAPANARGLARIRRFAANWPADRKPPLPTVAERQLIERALIDYLFDEASIASSVEATAREARKAIDHLRSLAEPFGHAPADDAAVAVSDLATRLDNQEDLNLAMREHLTLLSEELRLLGASPLGKG